MSTQNVHVLRPVARTSRVTPPTPVGLPRNDFAMDPLSTRLDNYANILLTNHPTVNNPFDVSRDLPKRWEIERPCRKIQDSSGSYTFVNNSNVMSESVAIGQDVYKFENMPKTLVGDLTDAVQMMHDSFYRIELSQLPIAQSLYNLTKWSNVYMRILLNLVKVPENCYRLGISEIPAMFAGICLHVFSQKVNSWDQESQKNAIKFVSYMIEFYDYLYDPLRLWRNHSTNQMKALDILVEVPQLIESFHLLFIDGLRQGWGPDTPEFAQLQVPLINIFGSAIFGSVSNALGVLKPATVMAVLSFLSPDPVTGINSHFIGPILEIIVKIIHLTVSFKDQVGITNNIILRSYLELLNIQSLSQLGKEGLELLFSLLERIPNICSTNDKSIIQCEFEVAGIFTKMLDILDYETPMETRDKIKLYSLVLESITACLSGCSSSKSAFEAFIGYNKLVRLVFKKVAPCEDVLAPLLLMVIERAYHEQIKHCVVQNVPLLLTLLDFTPELSDKLQIWFGHKLQEICVQSSLSALKCSLEGITLKLLAMVESVQDNRIQLEKETLESIFKILEFVGRHSITALELKQIISLMRVTADTKQPSYSARLVKCLEEIASKDGRIKAQSYFDLHDSDSGISLPAITWPGSAFTFHCWIFIDPTSRTIMSSPNHMVDSISTGLGNLAAFPIRRIVYSFLNNHDIGFEAFITPDCHLVIAVSTKKEYYTFEIRNFAFVDYNWHSLAVVHRRPKQILSDQSECVVYLNGVVCDRFVFRMPSLKDTFRSCHIGNRPGINPADVPNLIYPRQTKPHKFSEASTVCPISHQHEIWGYPGSLGGLLGSVVVFAEALTQQQIQLIHSKGTNDLSTFHSCSLTNDLGCRLVVFYHPAACIEETCQDLTPSHIYPDQKLTGLFKGQCYTTHDIRYIINHVGGVELLFPLLENILLSQSVDYSKQQQQQQSRQSSDFEEIAAATGEFPLALGYKPGFRGSIYSNSVDNIATDSVNQYVQKNNTSTSLDFLRSSLSPTLPRAVNLFKSRLRRTISTPPPPKKETGQSTPNLRTEKPLSDNPGFDRTLFYHNQYKTKNSVPIHSQKEYNVSTYDSEEMLELNPKLKMIQKFPEILQANGDLDRLPSPAIKIQTIQRHRKVMPKSPSIKFSSIDNPLIATPGNTTILYRTFQ